MSRMMKRGKKLIKLDERNTNSIDSEEFYCNRPWSNIWQATLGKQWLKRPSSLVQQDSRTMQWLEFWLRISDSKTLDLLAQFEQAGYLKRLKQVGKWPHFKVKPSYHEEIRLHVIPNCCSDLVKGKLNFRTLNAPRFVTDCNRAWTSMRILCTFSTPQIEICSDIRQSTAKQFVYQLYQIGYLQLVECYNERIIGSDNVYQLCRNSGPLAPLICSDGIAYDINSRKLYMTQ